MSTTPMEDAESQKNVEAPVMTSVAAANSVDYKGRPIDHARTGRYKAASFLLGTHQVWILHTVNVVFDEIMHRVCAFWWDVFIFKVFSMLSKLLQFCRWTGYIQPTLSEWKGFVRI
jgi:hypothetical protein